MKPKPRFEIVDGRIVFRDCVGGEYATLYAASGQPFTFNGYASSFNDAKKQYAWAFDGPLVDGLIVFATKDREIVGEIRGITATVVHSTRGLITREDGKPIAADFAAFSPVEPTPKTPSIMSRLRGKSK